MEKYAFISDLDDYFCEKYANYDRMCVLKGYVMPKMQTTQRREDGTDYSYTLPPETMRLSLQENKAALLKQLKERMVRARECAIIRFRFRSVRWDFSKSYDVTVRNIRLKRCLRGSARSIRLRRSRRWA